MAFILTMITNFFNSISESFNDFVNTQEKRINLGKLSILKSSYSLSFIVAFLLANATSMSAVIFKDALGTFGMIFPISSCILLYGIAFISAKNMIFYSKESKFYQREFEESQKTE